MKSLTRGHLKAGIDSMRGSRWRNTWTILGIIIGVTSVITVVGLGEGIKHQISGQIGHYSKNVLTIQPTALSTPTGFSSSNASLLSGPAISGSLSDEDLNAVNSTPGISKVVPLSALSAQVKSENGNYRDGLVIGTSPDLAGLINQSMQYGVFLSGQDNNTNAAVLGQHAAQKLFNEDVPLGASFSIDGQQFIVRGIFNNFVSTPLSQQANFNNAIFIPYAVAQSLTKNAAVTYEILAQPTNGNGVAKTVSNLQRNLTHASGGQSNFVIQNQSQMTAGTNSVLDLLTKLISGVAAISLLVGGIGIMDVMLVSVTERMHEIGIRKALGATNRQILSQFMVESTVLSLTGGLIGIILSLLIDLGLRLATNLQPSINWQIVLIAATVSIAIGIIFGSVPALKAARKDPIEALRGD